MNVELVDVVPVNALSGLMYKPLRLKTFDGHAYTLKVYDADRVQYIEYETDDKNVPFVHALNKHGGLIKVKSFNNARLPEAWADLVEVKKNNSE